jgi:hypothetical protein
MKTAINMRVTIVHARILHDAHRAWPIQELQDFKNCDAFPCREFNGKAEEYPQAER